MRTLTASLVLALLVAGCVAVPSDDVDAPPAMGAVGAVQLGSLLLHNGGAQAGLSYIHHAGGPDATIAFPEGVLVQDADGRLVPATEPVALAPDGLVAYLAPYTATRVPLTLVAGGETSQVELELAPGNRLVSGDLGVELMKVQRDQFPHKSPGHENYGKAIAYFAEFFGNLSYDVEVNDYGAVPPLPAGNLAGGSLSSVVAYKRGTLNPERYLVMGGHFDVVEQTVEGAFDNTAGCIQTLMMAKAFQNITTEHTMVFACWGGEEDGIVGSQAWLAANPQLVPFIDAYYNFDVATLAWPAPKIDPAPIVVSAGPDGPLATTLHGYAAEIEAKYLQTGATFDYQGVAQGQAAGAGVNAQSDHTPFMSRGIPVYFTFTQRVDDVFTIIHSEVDTIENMTKYSLGGIEAIGQEFTPEQMAEGEEVLARSFETQAMLGFYYFVLTDAGVFPPARAPPVGVPSLADLR